jgi:hypothetical protein
MPYLTFGEAFDEMWSLSREHIKRRTDFESLAYHCIEQAEAGEPCILYAAKDYPMAKFVCALQDEAYAPLMGQVFSAFVRHGLLDPNRPFDFTGSVDCPHHYRSMQGELPLVPAVLKGNIHAAELLVRHGADTSYRVSDNVGGFLGEDFFDFVKLHFGETQVLRPKPEERAAAAARLLEASMERRISNAPAQGVAAESTARRRLRLV